MDRMAANHLLLLVFQYRTTGCGDLVRKEQRLKYHYYPQYQEQQTIMGENVKYFWL